MRSNNASSNLDAEQGDSNYTFSGDIERKDFIKKVFCTLSLQLVLTIGIIYIFVQNEDLQDYVMEHKHYFFYGSAGVFIATSFILGCCSEIRRKAPLNYIFLCIFTVAMGIMCGVVSSIHEPIIVLSALGLTAAVCFVFTIFSLQTKIDFNFLYGFMLIALTVLLVAGLLMFLFPSHIMKLIYSSLGVLSFSLFLLYDIQKMLDGDHEFGIEPGEHIYAALCLYIDIAGLFLHLLTLLGESS